VFVGGVRLGAWGGVLVVCVSVSGVLFSVGVCVCDLLIFLADASLPPMVPQAMDAFQTAADYYQGEESTTQANQCLLKVAGFAATSNDFKKAVEIYEQARQPVEYNT